MNTPPNIANQLLKFFCKPELLEDIQGDLEEEFAIRAEKGKVINARWWYYHQVFQLIRPRLIKKIEIVSNLTKETIMYKNYLKIAIRNLMKYKSGALINIIGLSTGVCAFLLIALFVKDELSYDKNHEYAENVYRLTIKNYDQNGDVSRQWAFASAGHAKRLKADYPEITHAVRFYCWAFPDLKIGEKLFPSEQVVFADNDVFDVFTFPFLLGNSEQAFREIKSLVLTESTAIKLFGNDWRDQDILGKTVKLSIGGREAPFQVSGVIEDMPEQQHFHFDYLAPIQFVEQLFGESTVNNVTGNYNWLTYLRLQPGTDPSVIEDAKDEFFDKYVGEFGNGLAAKDFYAFELQPLLDIHLQSNLEGEFESNGSLRQIYIFGTIGILLLIVACINYMNLATSHFSRRMKEIGVRKVLGARRSSLIKQFLTESIIINLVAFPIACILAVLALPYLNDFMGKTLTFNFLKNTELFTGLILLLLFVAILSGSYPAILMARTKLLQALKGESAINSSKWNFRNWLVTFQYAVTIGLIFTLGVIQSQMQYIRTSDPGFRKDQILQLSLSRRIDNLDVFKNEILKHPDIKMATYASRIPTGRLLDNMGASFFKNDSAIQTNFRLPYILIDEDFISTFEIPLIAGKNFTSAIDMEKDSVGYYLVNRSAAEALGYNNPQEIIGQRLSYGPYNGSNNMRVGRIMGVIEDFHFESLHSKISPMVMLKGEWDMESLCMQIDPSNIPEILNHIEETWVNFDPVNSPDYRFLDEMFAEQYEAEQRLGTMISVFTFIAILIGSLGLIGMVGFIIDTRYKEIGIRKVLGATLGDIVTIIGTRFLILIGIAFSVAIPVAYLLISDWLNGFVYHIHVNAWLILLPAIGAMALTILAISYQTIKASLINPVECLQDE